MTVFLALIALVLAVVALTRANHLESNTADHARTLKDLARHVQVLEADLRRMTASSFPDTRTVAPPEPPAVVRRPIAAPEPPIAATPPSPPSAREHRVPPPGAVHSPRVPAVAQDAALGPPSPPPLAPPPSRIEREPPAEPAIHAFDWEDIVGVRLFSWIAAIALALGVVLFLRYSIQAGWLQPPVRMAMGIVVGLALLVGCEMKVAREYPTTANALDAAGAVILFATFFAAFERWHLIPAGAAFLLLGLVTAVTVLLSIRRDSLFIAALGLVGGFLTPALLSTGQDNPVGLFGYLLVLNAGLAWVAYRKRWALLTAASLALTTIYQWSWVAKFLTSEKLPLATGIFLVFPLLGFVALALARRRRADGATDPTFSTTASIGGVLPLLFACVMAAVPAYGEHTGLLFGFLFCIDAGLLAVSLADTTPASGVLHVAAGFSTNVIFLYYLAASYKSAAWPGILGFVVLFVALYLAAPFVARLVRRPLVGPARYGSYAGASLLFAFPVLVALEPAAASPALPFIVLFVLVGAVAAFALSGAATASPGIHFVAAFFALVTEAVWSASYLTEARLLPALVVYLAFALFYIGVPVLARRLGRPLQPQAAGIAILLVSLAVLFVPAGLLASDSALWGLALLVAILNVAVFVEGASIKWPVASLGAGLVSWLVIATWWTRASTGSLTGPGLLVVAGFAVLTLGGHAWMAARADRTSAETRDGVYLGLLGHLFLLFVAGQPALSIPPWPMLAVLLVLDLAVGAAALYLRQPGLHLSALGVSALVLLAWLSHAVIAPWPAVALAAAAALAALALAWMRLARAAGGDPEFVARMDAGGAFGLVLAQVVAMFVAGAAGAPAVGVLMPACVVFTGALLAVAAFRQWNWLALLAVGPYAVTVALWQSAHFQPWFWLALLSLAGGVYAVFVACPLLLGRRAGKAAEPYEAAVLASAVFFFAGRHGLAVGGFGQVIGILPVFQAALMALLLWNLLRLEAPGARAPGRLALVAGAALAFVTLAIPLQLEKEWITIGWALEGAALAWLYRRLPHRGLVWGSAALLAAAFVRLALNPAVFAYQPRGLYAVWNWYLYTYLVAAGALLLSSWLFRSTDDALVPVLPRARTLAASGGVVLLFLLLNIEIADVYSTGPSITFNLGVTLAQDMAYTLGWAVFAVALLVAGIVVRSRPARFAALALLVVSVLKAFLHDLARLGGLYRVVSLVGLAICLALVAIVLQKFVLRPPERNGQVGNA